MSPFGPRATPVAARSPEGDGRPAVALGLSLITAATTVAALTLVLVNRPAWNVWQWYFVVDLADAVVYGVVGYVLLARSRRAVSWIVAGTALGGALAALGAQWTELRVEHPGVPELEPLQAMQNWTWIPGTLALFLVVPWIVRPGRPGPLARAAVVAGTALIVALVVVRWTDPFPWPDGDPIMPLAIRDEDWVATVGDLIQWAYLAAATGGLAAAAAVTWRWLVLHPDDRRGLGWLAVATALVSLGFVPIGLPPSWTDFLPVEVTPLTHLASQLFFPGALLVAVLGQRLWGIRLAVSRTLAWSLLTGALIAGYVGLIALSGLLFPGVSDGIERVAVTALLAAAIDPLRRFVQRRVDHLVHGEGAEPIRVVGRVGRGIGAAATADDLLAAVVRELTVSLRLSGARIDVADSLDAPARSVTVGDLSGADALVVPLVLDDDVIGSLHLCPRAGERIDGTAARTATALAPLVAVAARLAATAVALAESRSRLTTARDEERRALRRELHDGLGPALAGVGYGLQATRNLLATDPDAAGALLDRLIGELDARVADVRTLARELVPPVLVEDGLPAALAELAERQRMSGLAVELDIGDVPALPTDVATTLYAVAVEALRNVVRHADATTCSISLAGDATGRVTLTIGDDGTGVAADAVAGVGTQSMRERAAALGAVLTIGSAPAGGTLVAMTIDRADRP